MSRAPSTGFGRVNLVHWHPNGPSGGVVRDVGVVHQLWLHAGAPPAVSALGACTAASPAASPGVHHRSPPRDKRCSRLPMWQVTNLQLRRPNRVGVVQRPTEPPAASQCAHSTTQHGTAPRSTARIDRDSGRGRLIAHSHRNPKSNGSSPLHNLGLGSGSSAARLAAAPPRPPRSETKWFGGSFPAVGEPAAAPCQLLAASLLLRSRRRSGRSFLQSRSVVGPFVGSLGRGCGSLAGWPRRGRAAGRTVGTQFGITLRQHGADRKCDRHGRR